MLDLLMSAFRKLMQDYTTYVMVAGAVLVAFVDNALIDVVGMAAVFLGALFDDKMIKLKQKIMNWAEMV